AHVRYKYESFKVLKFETLTEPTARHGSGSYSIVYGDIKSKLSPVRNECFEDVQMMHDTYTHTQNNNNDTSIVFDQLIQEGIIRVQIKNIQGLLDIGIADQSVIFGRNENPEAKGMENVVIYNSRGRIVHIGGKMIEGNRSFGPDDIITLEFNMNKDHHTLTFFINYSEQKNYISDLPSTVRFWCHLKDKGSSFEIISLAKLSEPVAEHKFLSSSKFKWGKKW
ncbi:MAG: hypothetical protein EZS28_039445, partial [Streblomastix strix]